jgi:uncharacterized GH25 family protein
MKKVVATVCLLFVAQVCLLAHEFWIKPSKFFLARNEPVDLIAMVGEGYEGEPWGGDERRLVSFDHTFGKVKKSLLDQVNQSDNGVEISSAKFETEGTHLLTFSTNNSYLELEASEFLAYLKEDGLEEAIAIRDGMGETVKKSREFYRRSAKVLLQVGNEVSAKPALSSDLILDIVPESNPYALRAHGKLSFQIRYKNKPKKDALVRCWKKAGGNAEVVLARSDKKGMVSFDIDREGDYMISVVTMERLFNNSQADWQSTWGSLVFGIDFD